jgi:hypothetical protein
MLAPLLILLMQGPTETPLPKRPVVYQALPRLFGNRQVEQVQGGSLAQNGCGRFADFDDRALASLAALGINTLWLTGVHEQASLSAHPGRPADDPDIVKGQAGSPYAIRDYYDVCPDYARDPARRLEEFRELLARAARHGIEVWIDLVPNHVARSYHSDVRPAESFGARDDRTRFFARDNHFFYLSREHPGGGPPLRLPGNGHPGSDGRFAPETEFGRITGNNAITWAPSVHDWYETVKLNWGHDFTNGRDTAHLPGPGAPESDVPATWRAFDRILAYWQAFGVAGFRVDMAHLVPMPAWAWLLRRAKARGPLHFCAEAYDNDPAKLTDGNVLDALLAAGFDSVYDDPLYDLLEGLYEGGKWCNDFDALVAPGRRFDASLRYGENHDEVRLANPQTWGGMPAEVGRPACAVLYGLGRGPLMLYHGQEVGAAALEPAGFGGHHGRTSIFDYTAIPELQAWFNGGRCDGAGLSAPQRDLRAWYGRLLGLVRDPAFVLGETLPLNRHNVWNPEYGRLADEPAAGHWLYCFLRHEPSSGRLWLVAAHFDSQRALRGASLLVPAEITRGLPQPPTGGLLTAPERLSGFDPAELERLPDGGWRIRLPELPPLDAGLFELFQAAGR